MSTRDVVQGDVPELRIPCAKVTAFDETLHTILDDLADTMKHHCGIGLAGPQIGQPIRAFVIDVGDGVLELVNPELTDSQGEQESVESCLSFPSLTLQLRRPSEITIVAQDRFGRERQYEASGLFARVVCHELDHLNGVLFTDHLSDEEVFAQVWMQLGEQLEGDLESAMSGDAGEIETSIALARHEEIVHAVQILADASWKVTLALELLRDHEDLLPELELAVLTDIDSRLSDVADELEQATADL
jgi:peptide deformylase